MRMRKKTKVRECGRKRKEEKKGAERTAGPSVLGLQVKEGLGLGLGLGLRLGERRVTQQRTDERRWGTTSRRKKGVDERTVKGDDEQETGKESGYECFS